MGFASLVFFIVSDSDDFLNNFDQIVVLMLIFVRMRYNDYYFVTFCKTTMLILSGYIIILVSRFAVITRSRKRAG